VPLDQGDRVDRNASEAASGGAGEIAVAVTFTAPTGPVSGIVAASGRPQAAFHGWLELMDALEAARGDAEDDEELIRARRP
jgi:hypothetical protein